MYHDFFIIMHELLINSEISFLFLFVHMQKIQEGTLKTMISTFESCHIKTMQISGPVKGQAYLDFQEIFFISS